MKNKYIHTGIIAMALVLLATCAGSAQSNQDKYWFYRNRLLSNYVAYSDDYNIPGKLPSQATHSLTETLFLSHPCKSGLNPYSLKATCYKPFLAVKDTNLTRPHGKNKQHNFIKGLGAAFTGAVTGALVFGCVGYIFRIKWEEKHTGLHYLDPAFYGIMFAGGSLPIGTTTGLIIHHKCKKKKEIRNSTNSNISLVYSVNAVVFKYNF